MTKARVLLLGAAVLGITFYFLLPRGGVPVVVVMTDDSPTDEVMRALVQGGSVEVRLTAAPRVLIDQGQDVSLDDVARLPVQHRSIIRSRGRISAVHTEKLKSHLQTVIQEDQDKLYSLQAKGDGSLQALHFQAAIAQDLAMARAQLQLLKQGQVVWVDGRIRARQIPGFHVITSFGDTAYVDAVSGENVDPPLRDFTNARSREKYVQFQRDIHEGRLKAVKQPIAYPIQLSAFPEVVAAMERTETLRRAGLVERAHAFNQLSLADRKRLYEARVAVSRLSKAIQHDQNLSLSAKRRRIATLFQDKRYKDKRAAGLRISPNEEYTARIPTFDDR
ncbi:MAG: hypothetical protein ACYTGW_03170 [Planctomycetota bacterium]|jgi:hypothetical protein